MLTIEKRKKEGIGLALSGGGFRSSLFQLGSLRRINEFGLLRHLDEITSVSGGSITSAVLGIGWKDLRWSNDVADNLEDLVCKPVLSYCARTIDITNYLAGALTPFRTAGDYLVASYDRHLLHGASLQDLPDKGEGPRFTFYSTSLQTGVGVRFSRPYIGEYNLGLYRNPNISLAKVVAASSAFPPPFCPIVLKLDPDGWDDDPATRGRLYDNKALRKTMVLGDGGIYDNMGLERIWDRYTTVLVSDAGAPFKLSEGAWSSRLSNLVRTKRTLDIAMSQVGSLRTRWVLEAANRKEVNAMLWRLTTPISKYELEETGLGPPIAANNANTDIVAGLGTQLRGFKPREQGLLMNWSYALADAAIRRYRPDLTVPPTRWPDTDHPI